jgi:hypothetical protein
MMGKGEKGAGSTALSIRTRAAMGIKHCGQPTRCGAPGWQMRCVLQ